jgi:hypothetical protein
VSAAGPTALDFGSREAACDATLAAQGRRLLEVLDRLMLSAPYFLAKSANAGVIAARKAAPSMLLTATPSLFSWSMPLLRRR